tara:strand:+ start:2217 stop:2567 length:351 start_codon:yes stop_codon:yes gene_type:complete
MGPWVEGDPIKPHAFVCVVSFTGTTVAQKVEQDQFVRLVSAWNKKEAEEKVLRELSTSPRSGYVEQKNEVVLVQDILPSDLEQLALETKDTPNAGQFGAGKYGYSDTMPSSALVAT